MCAQAEVLCALMTGTPVGLSRNRGPSALRLASARGGQSPCGPARCPRTMCTGPDRTGGPVPHRTAHAASPAPASRQFLPPHRSEPAISTIDRRGFLAQSARAGLACWAGGPSGSAAPAAAADERKRLRVVTLEGEPSERGFQHGKTLKEPIHVLVKAWKADLAERYQREADAFI